MDITMDEKSVQKNVRKNVLLSGNFYTLYIAQLLSHFADAIAMFLLGALLVTLSESVGKSIVIAFLAFLIPQFLFGPVSGVTGTKFSKKWLLALSCFFRFLVLLVVVLCIKNMTHAGVYVVAALTGTGAAFFNPVKMSVLPDFIKKSDLKYANVFFSTTAMTALLLGTFGANTLALGGQKSAFTLVCTMYLISGLICVFSNFGTRNKNSDLKFAGYFITHKKTCFIVSAALYLQFVSAIVINAFNAMITDFYGLAFLDLTILRTVLGLGLIIGALILLISEKFFRTRKLLFVFLILLSGVYLTSFVCQNTWIACVWVFLTGVFSAAVFTILDTIMQNITPSEIRGIIFGLSLSLCTLSFIVGTMIVSGAIGFLNPVAVFLGVSLFTFALIVLFFGITFFLKIQNK